MCAPSNNHLAATCRQMYCFPDSSVGKESAHNAGNPSSIPGSGRSTGEGIGYPLQYSWASLVAQLVKNPPAVRETWVRSLGWGRSGDGKGHPLQYSGLENSMDYIVKELDTPERLSPHFMQTKVDFPGGKESTCQCRDTRDVGSVPGSGRPPGGGNGNPL